jgi:hypothetical protein
LISSIFGISARFALLIEIYDRIDQIFNAQFPRWPAICAFDTQNARWLQSKKIRDILQDSIKKLIINILQKKMPKSVSKSKPKAKDWRMREPRAKEVEKVKQALVTFLMTTNQGTPPFPPANMTTYRKVLPYLSELDKKWMIVREDAFTQTSYYHFKRVADIWRGQLRSK